jgi:hypothetical protein
MLRFAAGHLVGRWFPSRLCTLIHVDCLVTADAPNGLICIGQQLGALIPGVMARQKLP